ncbi:NAD+ synthase [Dehalococcoides mccartyi]|uniref:Glutamine-dependent NAD(+) synthetase n=1 Tax=Dehalococcoides mccartyi (strain VS) TaxID=311424 RepID=D2BIA9_DEHMV|nr:NAD+ synthase [Dehalococcoides mccartyi]ACZ62059.1 glutamine-dependent NAD(+) synthetase [Dehalococcoides mccartyi VS]
MGKLRLAMAQIDSVVGDLAGNTACIVGNIQKARSLGADVIAFPELAICGYPPEDLLHKPRFVEENLHALDTVIKASQGITVIVGYVNSSDGLHNSAAVIHNGCLIDSYHKIFLPNYGVFDENRYFMPGNRCPVYTICGLQVGVNICEDIWFTSGPSTAQASKGAELIINISASPYHLGKRNQREKMLSNRARENRVYIAYTNMVGGQDELVFDGASNIFDYNGNLVLRGKQFQEDLLVLDLDIPISPVQRDMNTEIPDSIFVSASGLSEPKLPVENSDSVPLDADAEVYQALLLGTKDYINKNGFKKVVIGLSGGIDSSLVAAIATDALGSDNVVGVIMPSRYSSAGSISDSLRLAENLRIKTLQIPIDPIFKSFLSTLSEVFAGTETDTTEENIQARIRGNLLMALSNKFHWLVLNTSNKSETAIGYSTLYGDMAGGFAIIKDVPKVLVYRLAHNRNKSAGFELIPHNVLTKPPSAELKPNQFDTDSLPPYEVLDPILEAYVEQDKSIDQIVALGFEESIVKRVVKMVDRSEYKRRQAPPGIKITPKAFGRDRRLPITNRYNHAN